MRVAKEFAAEKVSVSLYSTQYPEDRPMIPSYFKQTPDLERSVLDVGSFRIKRKLPLVADIINRLYEASDAQYFIYTNADIILLPQFYAVVDALIEKKKCDAMSIIKRIVPFPYTDVSDLSLIYANAGIPHIGHDCLVFPRSICPNFDLGFVCNGAPLQGAALIVPMMAYACKYMAFYNLHITCHIEDSMIWKQEGFNDYRQHNLVEYRKIWARYSDRVMGNVHYGLYDRFKRITYGRPTRLQKVEFWLKKMICKFF